MRFARLASLFAVAASVVASTIIACSSPAATKEPLPLDEDNDPPDPDKGKPQTTPGDPANVPDTPLPEAAPGTGRMFSHTADTLYLFEPIHHVLTKIGQFDCLSAGDSVIDIALDRTEQMYGTTFQAFIKIDPLTAKCTKIKDGLGTIPYPNSLSFVPAGTVDPTKEVLVGYAFNSGGLATNYVKINAQTGLVENVGDLNTLAEPNKWAASGDMISLIQAGNKSYLTVKLQVAPEAGAVNDSLAEIDPSTGRIKSIIGMIGTMQTYGLGYWAGKGYGFAANGNVIEIDMTNGSSNVVQSNVDPSTGALLPWYGAGVGTQAPIN